MIPMYNTIKFTDIYKNQAAFLADYSTLAYPTTISTSNATVLYYLLYARFGNSPIANFDVNQFKYKLFGIIWQYGPTWEKRLSIQNRLRTLTEDEMKAGARTIMNSALNPDQEPTVEEIAFINQQNTNKSTKSILGAYGEIWELLKVDVTEELINKFKPLFKAVVMPERTYLYITEEEE